MQPNYYAVLDVPRSADSAQIRRAYKEQALRHHPDKNPDRLEEATERFKLIAEAFSVLQNPEQRTAYDRGDSSNTKADFGDAFANDLFRDVFGMEAPETLLQVVAQVAKATDACGKVGVVRAAVIVGFGSMISEADSTVALTSREEEVTCGDLFATVKKLRDFENEAEAVRKVRFEGHVSLWQRLNWKAERRRKKQMIAFDRESAQQAALLRKNVHRATAAWKRKHENLENAERAAHLARLEVGRVQRDGASLEQTTKAAAHLLGRVSSWARKA